MPGGPGGFALAPVVDGTTLPNDPFDPVAPALSANIPLLIGTIETEVTFFPHQVLDPINDTELHTHVKQTLRTASDEQVDQLIAAYKKGRPGASNTDLFWLSRRTRHFARELSPRRSAKQLRARRRFISITSPGVRRFATENCGRSTPSKFRLSSTTWMPASRW